MSNRQSVGVGPTLLALLFAIVAFGLALGLGLKPDSIIIRGSNTVTAANTINFVGNCTNVTSDGVTANVTVTCDGGGGGNISVVMDSLATPTYPTSPSTEGIWYGEGAKAGTACADSISIGNGASSACQGISIGTPSHAYFAGIGIGHNANCSGPYSICLGAFQTATSFYSVVIGPGTSPTVTADNAVCISCVSVQGVNSVAVGLGSQAFTSVGAVAVGANAQVTADNSVALGITAFATVPSSVAIGGSATTLDTAHAFGIGINVASVTPVGLGATVNNVAKIIPFSISFATTSSSRKRAPALSLTATSARVQRISGTAAFVVRLPSTATLTLGHEFRILNDSTAAVTVTTSTSVTVTVLVASTLPTARGGWGYFTLVVAGAGDLATQWSYQAGALTP